MPSRLLDNRGWGAIMLIEVRIWGCHDSNIFSVNCTKKQYEFLKMVADMSANSSSYSCEPKIKISEWPKKGKKNGADIG